MTTFARLHLASGATDAADATGAVERRLGVLRQTAEAGGTIAPVANPQAEHGYSYPALSDAVESDLRFLAEHNYLEARFFDRVRLCPKCGSHHLNIREICPGCRRAHLSSEGLFHHFRCGNVGLPSEFTSLPDGGYLCPKCNRTMHHLGTEYDRLGRAFACHSCGLVSENPPIECVCLVCGDRGPVDKLVGTDIFSYVLTSRGASAISRGALLDDGGHLEVSVADAPVYRRALTLEFLDHEVKRLQHFNSRFSVLLIEHPVAPDRHANESPAPWLIRLRGFLRETDVLGQLADALFIVILPQTKRRTAEALSRRIATELGPQSPLRITAAHFTDHREAASLLARHAGPGVAP